MIVQNFWVLLPAMHLVVVLLLKRLHEDNRHGVTEYVESLAQQQNLFSG